MGGKKNLEELKEGGGTKEIERILWEEKYKS